MRRLPLWILLLFILAILTGCAQAVPSVESNESSMPVPLATPISNESGLTIEENEIVGEIQHEPLNFQPLHGSQRMVYARHAREKQKPLSYLPIIDPDESIRGFGHYKAVERVQGRVSYIEVIKGGETLFRASAGHISTQSPLRRLWVQDDHWTLEISYVTNTISGNVIRSLYVGKLYQDGVLLNDQLGYEEMFGYQLLDGKPFYFYKNDGQIHLSYNSEDLPITYDDVPHYRCCSGDGLNPIQAGNWVGFFGKRGETWYYTEIGKY